MFFSIRPGAISSHQFANQAGKGAEEAKLFILNKVYNHLEKPKAHVEFLSADFPLLLTCRLTIFVKRLA